MARNKEKLLKKYKRHYESQKRRGVIHKKYLRKKERGYYKTNRWVFNHYKGDAKFRGLSFELTKDQVFEMIGKPCAYCGDILQKIGIDRVDNEKGYTVDNSVPCCTICNLMKRTLLKEVFIAQCEKIINNCR